MYSIISPAALQQHLQTSHQACLMPGGGTDLSTELEKQAFCLTRCGLHHISGDVPFIWTFPNQTEQNKSALCECSQEALLGRMLR